MEASPTTGKKPLLENSTRTGSIKQHDLDASGA